MEFSQFFRVHQLYNLIYLSVCLASASWKWHIRCQKTRLHQHMWTIRIGKGALVQRDADLPSSMSKPLWVDLNRDNWRLQFLSSRYSDSVYTTSTHFLFMLDTYETVCSVPYTSKYDLWYDNHVLVLTAYSAFSLQKRQGCVRILKLIHISNLLILFSGLLFDKTKWTEPTEQLRIGRSDPIWTSCRLPATSSSSASFTPLPWATPYVIMVKENENLVSDIWAGFFFHKLANKFDDHNPSRFAVVLQF